MTEELKSIETDTLSRNRIVSETDWNFFVEAGAGSGKTTMLVNRMVAMVEQGKDISKICAITFTKAAAGEFYDRFQKLLIKRSNPDYVWEDLGLSGQLPKPNEETRKRCAYALQNIDLCFMGTIDSFCNMILSEHPSETRIPSDAAIISDTEAQALYQQCFVKICEGEYGEELKATGKTFQEIHRNAQDVFVRGMIFLMNNRNVTFHYKETKSTDPDQVFADEKKQLLAAFQCLLDHPELMYSANKESVTAWGLLSDACRTIRRKWSTNYSSVMYAIKSIQKIRLLPVAMERYERQLEAFFEPGGAKGKWLSLTLGNDGGLLEKMKNLRYDVSMSFLIRCIPVVEAVMKEKGNLTFFDYLFYLRNMLKEDAQKEGKLIQYIYNRHSYFLIDEFQDTNPMQAEVFFYLASEHPVSTWSDCVPRPGSLFIVGDPKQSIYRFRSADVTSFLNVKKLFYGQVGGVLYLSRNFRSTKMLCGYFNRVFTEMLPAETKNQSKFEEIPLPDKVKDEFQGIYTYRAYTGKAMVEHPDETDPVQIGKMIDILVNNEKFLITTGNDALPRRIRYNDIMVITYGKSKLGPIMQHLEEKEIPVKVEGKVPFEANEALRAVYQIYGAVADQDNQIALYGALTGRILSFTKEEIQKFCIAGGSLSLKAQNVFPEGISTETMRLMDKMQELKEMQEKAVRLSPAALFSEIVDTYEVYRYVEADNLEVLYYTLELLRNAEGKGQITSAKDGAAYLQTLLAGASEEERCLNLNEGRDCVHMANLHKVKGLEAPVVILAAAAASSVTPASRMEHGTASGDGYLFRLEGERNENGAASIFFETSDYAEQAEAEKEALLAEQQRLVYVAATRARNTLILCDSIRLSGKGTETHTSRWKTLMDDGTPDFFESFGSSLGDRGPLAKSAEVSDLYDQAKETCILSERNAETESYLMKKPSHVKVASKLAEEEGEVIIAEGEDGTEVSELDGAKAAQVHRFPALLGTMTHRLMEIMVSTKNTFPVSEAIDEIIREYGTPKNKPFEKQLAAALSEVARVMQNGGYEQTNAAPKDILKTLLEADEVYCEVPFCYKEDDADGIPILWNGVMDVVYCKDGIWHIIDYKTNIDGTSLDARYQSQLLAYQNALFAATGHNADAYTYHISI